MTVSRAGAADNLGHGYRLECQSAVTGDCVHSDHERRRRSGSWDIQAGGAYDRDAEWRRRRRQPGAWTRPCRSLSITARAMAISVRQATSYGGRWRVNTFRHHVGRRSARRCQSNTARCPAIQKRRGACPVAGCQGFGLFASR